MNVNDVFEIINYAINKNQNGTLIAEDFNRILPLAESGYINYLLGSFSTYQAGRPISKVELGQNSIVRQRLSPIIKRLVISVNSSGFAPYPARYIQTDAMWTNNRDYKRIRWTDQYRWSSKNSSVIDPVSSNYIYMINDTGFEFSPISVGSADLSYVQATIPITWGFTLDANNRRVYSASTSVQPVWNDVIMLEIIVRALALIGVNLQLKEVENYSQVIKNQGQ